MGDAVAPEGPSRLGDFRIVREIGRGGMGIVYEAEQLSLRRRVALKVLPAAFHGDARVVERFQREAESAARLRHPGIVPVYTVGKEAGTPFIALELVDGRSVADVLTALKEGKDAGIPPAGPERRRWAVDVAARIADALHYAHGCGILHRDVKPGNVLLDRDGSPRLTDFGLALDVSAGSLTRTGEVLGSPSYMSPEQVFPRGTPPDPRSDVYSLAVTLYEMLTLRLPYEASTLQELLGALATGAIASPRSVDPEISPALEDVLLRALRKDPAERHPDAASFANDLRAVLEGVPAASAPSERHRRRPRRMWIAAGLVAAAAAAVAGIWPREPTQVPMPTYSDLAGLPTREEVVALADGTLRDGAEAIHRWFRPEVKSRSVVSRAQPGHYDALLPVRIPMEIPAGVVVSFASEVSVNDGDWKPHGSLAEGDLDVPGALRILRCSASTSDVLGAALLARADGKATAVTIAQRTTVRVRRRERSDAPPAPAPSGTSALWRPEVRTYFAYDDYPAGYPEVVSSREIDREMRAALTPTAVQYDGLWHEGGEKGVQLLLLHDVPGGPVPAACDVEVRLVDGDTVVARAGFGHAARPQQVRAEDTYFGVTSLPFRLAKGPATAESKFLLDLGAGGIEKLRLVFLPSRRTALEETLFDLYWGGTLDVIVPVKYGSTLEDSPR